MKKTLWVCLSFVFSVLVSIFLPLPAQATIGVSPTSLSFGSVAVNTTSASATIVITNGSHQSVSVQKISSSLPEFLVSGVTLPLALSPHSSTSFSVVFRPNAALTYSGKIHITISARWLTYDAISVTGTGIADPPSTTYLLTPSTSNLAFGNTLVGASASQSISLTNTGTGSVTVSQVAVAGSGFAVSGFSGAVSLASGQSLALAVRFAPSLAGSTSGTVTVTSNASNSPATIALSGTGIQPQISVTPASASFGSMTIGATKTQTITISNPGTASLTVSQASLSGAGFAFSGLTMPLTVPPGASSPFTVSFAPASSGTFSGTLTLVNNSPTSSLGVPLSGTAVAQVLQLSASPASLSFGNVAAGTSAKQTVTLTNTGSGSVTLSQDSVAGTAFSVTGLALPLTLAVGQSTSFNVAFAPSAASSVSGNVTVTSNASNSPATITLSGTGVQPQISVTPASVSFGSVTAGVTNTQTLTISNPGTANLTVTQASLSGTAFGLSGLTMPLTVPPGASSPFTVSFAPASSGTFSGTLTLVNNSPTSSLSVPLSGTGVAPVLQLSASPTSLSFGNVTTGTSATQTVTLTNAGNANVSLSQDSVTGTGFSVTGLTLPLTLAAGQSTSFTVAFAPTAAGSVTGSVTVSSNATNSPTTIPLSATGTSPVAHQVSLSWTPSSSSYSGFNVYRSNVSGGPYTKINASLISTPSYTDTNVTAGQTYYYVATEVDTTGAESKYSSETSATVP